VRFRHDFHPMKATALPLILIVLAFPPLAPADVPEGLNHSDWQSIREAYEVGRYAFTPTETGWTARNPVQRWTTEFDARGFLATPDEGDWTWGLELLSYGVGETRISVSGTPSVATEGHRLAYRWDEKLEEWWINDRRGLEHGFIVAKRPGGDDAGHAPLTFHLGTRGGLMLRTSPDARDLIFQDTEGRAVLNYAGLTAWDAEGRILPSRFEEDDGSTVRLVVNDRGAVYPVTIDPIAEQAYLKAGNTDSGDGFGLSVAVSGDTVIVGAQEEDSSAAGVLNGSGGSNDNSASSAGAAYVFVREGATWSQQAYLKAGNTDAYDYFGWSVAVSGDTAIVGAYGESSNETGVTNGPGGSADNSASGAGAAYVFMRSGTAWNQRAYLKAGNTDAGDWFGRSVAVSGETAIVGAYGESSNETGTNGPGGSANNSASSAGATYVFLVPELPPEPPTLTLTRPRPFPTTTIGKRSKPQTIRMTNSGGRTATGIAAHLSGKAAKDFLLTRPANTLAPGAATSFRATFRPRGKGARKANVTLRASNAAATSVPLKGRGK
jgi:trimeric autotransporter adhesin